VERFSYLPPPSLPPLYKKKKKINPNHSVILHLPTRATPSDT
jgi:hypothetical protein